MHDDHTPEPKGQHLPFNEGLPTRPDVDLLIKTWPDMKVGDRIEYESVEKLIGAKRAAARFRTVTVAWRRRMLADHGTVIECAPGDAFFVASAEQISSATYTTLSSIGRKAKRHRRKLATVKPETAEQKATVEHQGRLMLAVEKDVKKHRMNILPNTATQAQPQLTAPDQSSTIKRGKA